MIPETIQLHIPLESLLNAISSLGLDEKRKLWEMLELEISQAEEDLLEEDPIVKAEIEAAREAYHAGDYLTIGQYIAKQSELGRGAGSRGKRERHC